jgi:hypothetical protein
MALLSAALDASTLKTDQRKLLTKSLLQLFEENKTGSGFVRNEAEQHIKGWISAACVRNIALRARDLWKAFENQGKH